MSVTVYYEHGQVVKISPEPNQPYYEVRDIINAATSIVSDGVHYDLTDTDSIYSIEVPEYTYPHDSPNARELDATGYLEYVLRMHAGWLWNAGDYRLSMVCLGKACQLMLYSTIAWRRKDYFRIVEDYLRLGEFGKAKEWKDWIEKYTVSDEDCRQIKFNDTLASCKFLGTDLVEVGDLAGMCETCAKYRNRIYSLSGRNIKFPKFPKDFCFKCGLGISPFVDGVSEPSFNCISYVLHSRRPFKDDRTEKEIENYKKISELLSNMPEDGPSLNHIIYYWIKVAFPDDAPKTVGGFSRMRNSNSKKYQALVEKIERAGCRLPTSLDEVAEWEAANR